MEITAKELMEMNPEELLIIDIRNEYDRNYGLIPGSVWADAQELVSNPPEDRSKKIILYCARGIISVDLAQALCDQGYEAYSLQEGYLGGCAMTCRTSRRTNCAGKWNTVCRRSSVLP